MPSGRSKPSTSFGSATFCKKYPLSRHALFCNDDYHLLQCILPIRFYISSYEMHNLASSCRQNEGYYLISAPF